MKDFGYVKGNKEQAVELIVGVDTVYVHTDIQKLDDLDINGKPIELYQYHEVQYGKDEYIQLMAAQNKELNNLMNSILGVDE
jgi:hypothetical protein